MNKLQRIREVVEGKTDFSWSTCRKDQHYTGECVCNKCRKKKSCSACGGPAVWYEKSIGPVCGLHYMVEEIKAILDEPDRGVDSSSAESELDYAKRKQIEAVIKDEWHKKGDCGGLCSQCAPAGLEKTYGVKDPSPEKCEECGGNLPSPNHMILWNPQTNRVSHAKCPARTQTPQVYGEEKEPTLIPVMKSKKPSSRITELSKEYQKQDTGVPLASVVRADIDAILDYLDEVNS